MTYCEKSQNFNINEVREHSGNYKLGFTLVEFLI